MKSSLLINLYHVSPSRTTLFLSRLHLTAARRFLLHDILHLQIRARYTLLAKYACPEQLNTADRPSSSPSEGKPEGWLTENARVTNVSALALRCERWKKCARIFPSRRVTLIRRRSGRRGKGEGKKSGGERRKELKETKKQHQFEPHASLWLRI